MKTSSENLETYWKRYLVWCASNGLNPDFSDFTVWLDDNDIDAGQEQAEHESI